MDHRTLKFITQFLSQTWTYDLNPHENNIHNEKLLWKWLNMIGTITCLMYKNLHKKAFNYERYNVVCCQSLTLLVLQKQIETEFLNSWRIQIHSTLARALGSWM